MLLSLQAENVQAEKWNQTLSASHEASPKSLPEKRQIQKTFLVGLGSMESVLEFLWICCKNAHVSRTLSLNSRVVEVPGKNVEEVKTMKFLFSDERARAKMADAKAPSLNKRRVFKQLVQQAGKKIRGPAD